MALSTLVLMLFFVALSPLFAQASPLNNPSSIVVYETQAYNSILETDDALFIVAYDIFYADADDRPAENASQTMVVRLFDGATTHGVAVPISIIHRGYVRGVTGFYFDASDTDLPTWSSATLVAQVVGNPALTWVSGQPVSNQQAFTFNTAVDSDAQRAAIVNYLRGQVAQLETNWYEATAVITDLIGGQPLVLTSVGEEYFFQASPDQRNVTPDLYVFNVENIDLINYGTTYLTADVLAGAGSISVYEADRTGFLDDQEITLISASSNEVVTVTSVEGDTVSFTPVLGSGYSEGDLVWITAQVFQNDLDALTAGTFFQVHIIQGGATAVGMSITMWGLLLSAIFALGSGALVGMMVRGMSPYTFPLALMVVFLVLLLCTVLTFIDVVVLGIVTTLLVGIAVFEHFWKFG